jgi:hypothetical protein
MWSRAVNRGRVLALTVLALGCAAVLAACGSSKKSTGGVTPSFGIKFSECMRSHGVSNFPDPSSGGGINIPNGSGIDPQSPAFQSAQKACSKLLPGGGPPQHVSEARKLEMLKLARCMRSHGVPTFPDPTTNPPTAPPAGGGIAFGAPGSFLSVPQSLMQSPGFKKAAATCGFPAPGLHGRP